MRVVWDELFGNKRLEMGNREVTASRRIGEADDANMVGASSPIGASHGRGRK